MRMIAAAGVAWLLVALSGCDSRVAATNPYDPNASPDQQAPAALSGRIVLVDDHRTTRESLEAEMALVRTGLLGPDGAVVRNQDGSPLWARLEVLPEEEGQDEEVTSVTATFEFVYLQPGSYRLRVEGLGRRYAPPGMPEVELRPGARSNVGDLVFVSIAIDGPGPGGIEGVVRLEGGVGPDRTVELYRMESGRPELFTQKKTRTDGSFDFFGLPIGAYAVSANLAGYTPDYRLDIMIGEMQGAALTHTFAGDDSMLLRPVTAVLEPDVQRTEGVYYTNEDELPLKVLPFGGVDSMRISTDPLFLAECEESVCGEEVPFEDHSARTVVALPDVEGTIEIFAQFETRSQGGFVFVSPTFSTTVVRDVSKPRILRAAPIGVAASDGGTYFVTPGVTLEVDATDDYSAVAGGTLILAESMPDPENIGITVEYFPPGMARIQRPAPLPDEDGTWRVFAFVRDRAGNISEGEEIVLRIDRAAPELPLLVSNAVGGLLTTRAAQLELDETGEDDLPVTMQVGLAPLRSSAPVVPYEQSVNLDVTDHGHGSVVAFEARLTDAAGNSALVRSNNVVMSLTGTISGRVEVERVPAYRPDHGGVEVSLHTPGADPGAPALAEASTGTDGRFAFHAVPEAGAYLLRAALPGYQAVEQLVPGVLANQSLQLSKVEMRLSKGELHGRFLRYDEREVADAHAGIIVYLRLLGSSRTDSLQVFTAPDGEWRVEVPITLEGEAWSVEGMTQGYANANAGLHMVAAGEVTVVSADPEQETIPEPLMLHPISGDFVLCAPIGPCEALSYSNLEQLRVRLANTSVTEVRVRARDSFGPQDAEPAFVPFDSAEILTVNVSGPEGQVAVYVQTRVGTEDGPVLSSSFVRDTTPPVIDVLTIDPGPDSIDHAFTSRTRVSATLHADSGAGGGIPVAPLAQARLLFADEEPAAMPTVGFVSCGHGTSCEVRLPDEGDLPAERRHDLYGWACDMAGNCSAVPVSAGVIYDRTTPSSANGAWVSASEEGTVTRGGVTYTRSPSYYVDIALGMAKTMLGDGVLDLEGESVPDVLAYRLGVMAGAAPPNKSAQALSGTLLNVIEGEIIPGETIQVPGPPLPPQDGVYTVYAQLVDAGGNRSPLEAGPFFFGITLDRTPPSASFSLNGGETVTRHETVTLTVGYDPSAAPVRVELATDGGLFATVDERDLPLNGNDALMLPAGPAPGGDGVYTVHARFYDAAGNMTERQASITLDRTPPVVRQVNCLGCKQVEGELFTSAADAELLLDVMAEDSGGAVVSIEVEVNGVLQVPAFEYGGTVRAQLPDQDGQHQVAVFAIDSAGNRSPAPPPLPEIHATRIPVFLDRVAPGLTVTINDGDSWTNDPSVSVDVEVTDLAPSSGIHGIRVSRTTSFSGRVLDLSELPVSILVDNSSVDGVKTLYVEARDKAGNMIVGSDTIVLDLTRPQVTVTVAGGQTPINDTSTTFSATMTEDSRWAAAVGSLDCLSAPYGNDFVSSISSAPITLDPNDGLQRVVVCVKDRAGNIGSGSGSVTLDTTPPLVTIQPDGFIILEALFENDVYVVNDRNITLQLGALDATTVSFGENDNCSEAPEPYSLLKNVVLAEGPDGPRTISVQYIDAVNNATGCYSLPVWLDTFIAPFTVTLEGFDGHGGTTNSQGVQVTLLGVDLDDSVEMRFSNLPTFAGASWLPVVTSFEWYLTSGDGVKNVYVEIRDLAGNTAMAVGTIILDQTAPAIPTLQVRDIDDDGIALSAWHVELAWTEPEGVLEYELQRFVYLIDADYQTIAFRNAGASSFVDIVTSPGHRHHYRIRARDAIGNVSNWSAVEQALPIAPISRVSWMYDVYGRKYQFRPNRGTFSLRTEVRWRSPFGSVDSLTLPQDSTTWDHLNQGHRERFDEYFQFRIANQDSTLVYGVEVPLNIRTREVIGEAAMEASVAMDSQGRFHGVFQEMGMLWYLTNQNGEWEYENLGFETGHRPKIAVDAAGNSHIVYFKYESIHVRYLRYLSNASGGWVMEQILSDAGNDFDIGVDSTGHVHLTYVRALDHFYATNSSGTWAETWLSARGEDEFDTKLVLDSNGAVHVNYVNGDSGYKPVYMTNRTGAWTTEIVDPDVPFVFEVAFVIDDSNVLHSFYSGGGGIWHARRAPDGAEGWVVALAVGETGYSLDAVAGDDERLEVVYVNSNSIKHASYRSGDWEATVADGLGHPRNPLIFEEDSGRQHILYQDILLREMRRVVVEGAPKPKEVAEVTDGAPPDWRAEGPLEIDAEGFYHSSYAKDRLIYTTNRTGTWTEETVSVGVTQPLRSLVLDDNGFAHMTYSRFVFATPGGVYYATNRSGAWVSVEIESESRSPSLVLDDQGFAHVSYWVANTLKYANNRSGTWSSIVLADMFEYDVVNGYGHQSSIDLDYQGNVHIAYHSYSESERAHFLWYATNRSGIWENTNLGIRGLLESLSAIGVDSQGFVHLGCTTSRTGGVVLYVTNASGSWVSMQPDLTGMAGRGLSLRLDDDDAVHLSYFDGPRFSQAHLKYASNRGGGWRNACVLGSDWVEGTMTDIAIDSGGRAHIAFGTRISGPFTGPRLLRVITGFEGDLQATETSIQEPF